MIKILLLTLFLVVCIGIPYIAWAIFGTQEDDCGEYDNQPSISTAMSRR